MTNHILLKNVANDGPNVKVKKSPVYGQICKLIWQIILYWKTLQSHMTNHIVLKNFAIS